MHMIKITFKILSFFVLTWTLGGSTFAQSSYYLLQKNVLKKELKTCLLRNEFISLKNEVTPYLQYMPDAIGYLKKISQKRCEVVILRALNFGMSRQEIEEAIRCELELKAA